MQIEMGFYDAPQMQDQPKVKIDPYKSNIAVFGGPMSGKTTFIKTLLVRLNENPNNKPEEITYIIDFGGNIGAYSKFGSVCSCFDNSNEENVKRVFTVIEDRLKENSLYLNGESYYEVSQKSPETCPPHMTLIIENLNAFLSDERYGLYYDLLLSLCRDGLSKGLTIVITANDTAGTNRILANFAQKVVFEMTADNYFDIFNTRVSKPLKTPGRGLINIDSEIYEFQCYLPYNGNEDDFVNSLIKSSNRDNPYKLISFPDKLTYDNLTDYCLDNSDLSESEKKGIIIGLDYYTHKPVTLDTNKDRVIAIYGKRDFGKIDLLKLLINGIRKQHPDARFVYLDDGRKELNKLGDGNSIPLKNDDVARYNLEDFRQYLGENGYGYGDDNKPKDTTKIIETGRTPLTVFVLQSKLLYNNLPETRNFILKQFPRMAGTAESNKYIFIFSDVKPMAELDLRTTFNNYITVAFLLDNIGEFISDRGNKSVFADLDPKEMKATYAKCSKGDGFYYNIELDELIKMKIVFTD